MILSPTSSGATSAQIEAAAKRFVETMRGEVYDDLPIAERARWCIEAHHAANLIVPPGALLLDADDVAALRTVIDGNDRDATWATARDRIADRLRRP